MATIKPIKSTQKISIPVHDGKGGYEIQQVEGYLINDTIVEGFHFMVTRNTTDEGW